jgi:hypothetical protein
MILLSLVNTSIDEGKKSSWRKEGIFLCFPEKISHVTYGLMKIIGISLTYKPSRWIKKGLLGAYWWGL